MNPTPVYILACLVLQQSGCINFKFDDFRHA